MPRLRLLATSLLASALPLAAAQAPAAASPLTPSSPPRTFSFILPPGVASIHLIAPEDANIPTFDSNTKAIGAQIQRKATIAQLSREQARLSSTQRTQACAKLRVYGFTARDLQSPHPHASTETDCTVASNGHLKSLNLPATVSPATVSPVTVSPK